MDLEKSIKSYTRQWAGDPEFIKLEEDLERYEVVIGRTEPEVIIEAGTYAGKSAAWFADRGPEVITIDINPVSVEHPGVRFLHGSSIDPDVVNFVAGKINGRRTMVVLDSDHAAMHVAREIELYGPLVTPGCYMVVEDGIAPWAEPLAGDPGPMAAITALLSDNPDWSHDYEVMDMHPVTMHPLGWWRKN